VRNPLRSSRGRLLVAVSLVILLGAVVLPPIAQRELHPARGTSAATAAGRGTGTAATAAPEDPQVVAAREAALALHVAGNRFVTSTGQPVLLRGVNRDGTDFHCSEGRGIFDGPTGPASIAALLSWHINAVRLPLNEGCWLGGNPGIPPALSGAAYQTAIATYVGALTAAGIYVVLDLHKAAPGTSINTHRFYPMADADHAPTFWGQVATRFESDGMVLFDLYNEPHDISWPCWRDGGKACQGQGGITYKAVGMVSLIKTIRATGAHNVLLLSATGWGNNIHDWTRYAPRDPLGNLAASWHIYTQTTDCATAACFTHAAGAVAQQVPVVTAEFGTDVHGQYCGIGGEDVLLDWMDQHHVNYLAWTWNVGTRTCGDLALINDWDGTPSSPIGVLLQQHLLQVAPPVTPFTAD
jgi:endoglucanase